MRLRFTVPQILVLTVLILVTAHLVREIQKNQQTAQQITEEIQYVERATAAARQLHSQQQRRDPGHSPSKVIEEDSASLELEALGVKLKMINEATWSSVIKLCVLWAFALITALGYRWAQHRLGIATK